MYLGTAVLLSSVVTITGGYSPSSVLVSILAPDGTKPISNMPATFNSTTNRWQYIYQSGANGSGEYRVQWKAVYGANTGLIESGFVLMDTSI